MNNDLKSILDEVMNNIERILKAFHVERVVHLSVGVVAFVVLLISGVLLLMKPAGVSTTTLVSLFGSSGLVTASAARITYFFNRAFNLFEDVVRAKLRVQQADRLQLQEEGHGKSE